MLNRIAEATGTFIPVSSLLLDMLEMKELRGRPDGGVGKAVNLFSVKQVCFLAIEHSSMEHVF
jgi:nucleolar complex protein 2